MKPKSHRWGFRHLLLEVIVYVTVILAFAFAVRQFEGVSVGKIESELPSFLEFLK